LLQIRMTSSLAEGFDQFQDSALDTVLPQVGAWILINVLFVVIMIPPRKQARARTAGLPRLIDPPGYPHGEQEQLRLRPAETLDLRGAVRTKSPGTISPMAEFAGICFFFWQFRLKSGTAMYRWRTDEVELQDRFDYWREVRAKGLFGVTAELDREKRADFFGEFSLRQLGGAGFVELRASSYAVERSPSDIAYAPGNSVCVYQQLGSGGWFGGLRASDFAIANGSFATSHTDLPYRTAPLGAGGFHLRILKVPVGGISTQDKRIHALAPKTFNDPALAPLLASCFADLGESADDDASAETTALVQALAHLALIERGVVGPGSRRGQAALRTARLSLARRLIARHLQDPGLAPAMVADLLGISIRHLHMLFEVAERSFSQTVTDERLRQSRRLMREAPERLIAEVAAACGFESLATYYRVFNAAYGMAPGDFRAQATEGRWRPPPGFGWDPAGREAEKRSPARYLGKNLRVFRIFPQPLH
jgi:AraC-like DNA-binding protein